jgi:proteic killer suppression protein
VIVSFLHLGLKELFETGKSAALPPELRKRCLNRLEILNAAKNLTSLNISGFNTHPLHGTKPLRYSMSVNGPWRITFQFDAPDASMVDLEQYH